MIKKCWACGQNFKIHPEVDQTPKIISKPGAVLKVSIIPWPKGVRETISHNLQCPASHRNRYTIKGMWFRFKNFIRQLIK